MKRFELHPIEAFINTLRRYATITNEKTVDFGFDKVDVMEKKNRGIFHYSRGFSRGS